MAKWSQRIYLERNFWCAGEFKVSVVYCLSEFELLFSSNDVPLLQLFLGKTSVSSGGNSGFSDVVTSLFISSFSFFNLLSSCIKSSVSLSLSDSSSSLSSDMPLSDSELCSSLFDPFADNVSLPSPSSYLERFRDSSSSVTALFPRLESTCFPTISSLSFMESCPGRARECLMLSLISFERPLLLSRVGS
ncbi:predicted protein [Clavispora lusitaniae ATCC 42720]|uniref:Uncharacterized protein n=1 Tax=Clavispora lusitaniae (strain ATCC 42720) TaxID=306902 RepID=C4Y908_CLAL4|nr:uncharacterized protein CLUG_04685 [Clavispora lusitaniae ATCC 42720]EEQ40557.1 predicted protein [Clavispora lusitaniae ATCC 42720]